MHPQDRKRLASTKLVFTTRHNYKYCYVVGKFRLYIYDNEESQKIDNNEYQIMCGNIEEKKDMFSTLNNVFNMNTFLSNLPPNKEIEIIDEYKRIGMALSDGFKKVADEKGWFRITFNEMKYLPGERS
jgi:hypothetical protein